MAEKLAAAKAIRGLANLYRDMEAAAAALETIGSLEQAAEEAKKTVVAEQNKAVEARSELSAVLEQLQTAQAQVDTLRNQAVSEANSIVEEGKHQARLKIAAANEEAASIVAGANTEAGEILAKAEEQQHQGSPRRAASAGEQDCPGTRRDGEDARLMLLTIDNGTLLINNRYFSRAEAGNGREDIPTGFHKATVTEEGIRVSGVGRIGADSDSDIVLGRVRGRDRLLPCADTVRLLLRDVSRAVGRGESITLEVVGHG